MPIDFNVLVFDEFHFLVVIILDEAPTAPTLADGSLLELALLSSNITLTVFETFFAI